MLPPRTSEPGHGAIGESVLRDQMPELNCVRGVAILMVVFYHGFYSGHPNYSGTVAMNALLTVTRLGWTGVDLFFVLSGFLITGILVDAKAKRQNGFFARFYTRRALRILPLYYLFLVIAALVLVPLGLVSSAYLFLAAAYLANFAPYLGVAAHESITVIWSLAIEEHFYFVWPAIVRFLSIRKLFGACIALIVICPLLRCWLFLGTEGRDDGFSLTFTRLDAFAWGAVLAVFLRSRQYSRRRLKAYAGSALLIGTMLGLFLAQQGMLSRKTLPGAVLQFTCCEMIYSGVVAAVLLIGTSRLSALVSSSLLQFFGRTSYCLYLVHQLTFLVYDQIIHPSRDTDASILLRFGVVFALCVLLSSFSFRFFEQPFLRLKNHYEDTFDATAAVCVSATTPRPQG